MARIRSDTYETPAAQNTAEGSRTVSNISDRSPALPSRFKRVLQRTVHLISYYLNKRRVTTVSSVAGFRLFVPPTVFHPRYFLTSKFFAEFIGTLDLSSKRVADVGTGTGILALAAARAGAANVVALDINPAAARSAAENARANGLADCVMAVCSDLLSAIAPCAMFDVILANPPDLPDEPIDVADRGFCAGPECRDVASLFDQARERLALDGRMYVLLSPGSHLEELLDQAPFRIRLVQERSHLVESVLIYELTHA